MNCLYSGYPQNRGRVQHSHLRPPGSREGRERGSKTGADTFLARFLYSLASSTSSSCSVTLFYAQQFCLLSSRLGSDHGMKNFLGYDCLLYDIKDTTSTGKFVNSSQNKNHMNGFMIVR